MRLHINLFLVFLYFWFGLFPNFIINDAYIVVQGGTSSQFLNVMFLK